MSEATTKQVAVKALKGKKKKKPPAPAIPFRDRLLVGIDEIADHVGVCAKTIRNQAKAGTFPRPDRTIGRRILWKPSTVLAWIK